MVNTAKSFRFVILVMLSVFTVFSFGQQYDQFSGFYQNEISLNPAFTGQSVGKYRVSDIVRLRDYGPSSTDITTSLSAEMRLTFQSVKDFYGMKTVKSKAYSWGFGYLGQARLQSTLFNRYQSHYLSFAYHRIIKDKFNFSLGGQVGVYTYPNTYGNSYVAGTDVVNNSWLIAESAFKPDANVGFLLGFGKTDCWKEDQQYKLVFGLSSYHLMSSFSGEDSTIFPAQEIKFHAGYLLRISRSIGLVPRLYTSYNGLYYTSAGLNVLWRAHYAFVDRIRVGGFYRSDGYANISFGMRIFWGRTKNLKGFDLLCSYDLKVKENISTPYYKSAIEFSIVFQPFLRCWESSRCSDAYQFEEL